MSRNDVPIQESVPMRDMVIEGRTLRVRVEGEDTKPALVLSHMLGTDLSLWDDLVPAFAAHFRVVRYDTRGHGGSGLGDGPVSIEGLGRDVLAILDELGIERAHFCGLSMGGAVGLWLLAHAPARLERVVIAGSGPKLGTPAVWNPRIGAALSEGMEQAVAPTIERWFSPAFVGRAPDKVEAVRAMIRATAPEGYAACCAALRDMDLREAVRGVATPLLIVRGADDPSATAEEMARLVESMLGATALELDARHCCSMEAEAAFAAAVVKFLTARTAPRRATGRRTAGTPSQRAEPAARRIGGRGLVAARRPVAKTAPVSGKAVAKASATRKTATRKTAARMPASAIQHRRGAAKVAPAAAKTGRAAPATAKTGRAAPARSAPLRKAPPATASRRGKADASQSTKTKIAPARRAAGTARPSPTRAKTAAALRAAVTKTGSAAKASTRTTSAKRPPGAKTTTPVRVKAKAVSGKPATHARIKSASTGRVAAIKTSATKTSATKTSAAKTSAAKTSAAKTSATKTSAAKTSAAKVSAAKVSPAKATGAKAGPAKPKAGRRAAPAVNPRRPTGRGPGGSGRREP